MARKKRKTVISAIRLEKYAAEGKSIAYLEDGKAIFIEGAIPGDVAEVLVLKNRSSYAEGKALRIVSPSPDKIVPFCEHFGLCGGCKWQMLPYKLQLEYKHQQVQDQLSRIGKIYLSPIERIIGSEEQTYYRNKLEFTFSEQQYLSKEEIETAGGRPIERKPALGFHAPGMFDKIVDIQHCYLQKEPTNKIKNLVRKIAFQHNFPFYDYKKQEGWLRNLIIRISSTNEVMVNLIIHHERQAERELILNILLKEIPQITSLHYTINPKMNDTIYDLDVITYYGKGYIEERLDNYRFKISPKSFFQTNTQQAEKLYRIIKEFAGLTGKETVYDLYCGTGSIGIFLSSDARKVIGIETVTDAIKDAKINAAWNGLEHCLFFTGDVADIVTDAFFQKHGQPDVIITDPPRPGMSEKLVKQLLEMEAPRIVYVSCNPATQARDLQWLDEKYKILRIQPVDMFPHTHHIENVVLLELKTLHV